MMAMLMEAALRGLLVALTVWAGLRVLRVRNVPAQKAAWGLVLAGAVAMPLVMRWEIAPAWLRVRLPAPILRTAEKPAPTPAQIQDEAVVAPSVASSRTNPEPASKGSGKLATDDNLATPASAKLDTAPSQQGALELAPMAANQAGQQSLLSDVRDWADGTGLFHWSVFAVIVYLAVCTVLLCRMLYGLMLAYNLWESAEEFVPIPLGNAAGDPSAGLRMRFSRKVASPVTIGSGVLLPYECLEWDAAKTRIVLAHERAHVRQGDFYLQVLAGIYAAAFWFSPLGWWLKGKLSDLGETISDHAGLEEAANRASYAQLLLEFAAMPRPTIQGVAMARSRNLSDRIERLLNESNFRQAFAGTRRRVALAVLLVPIALFAGTALVRVEAAQAQQEPTPPPPPAAAPEPAAAPAVPATPEPAAAAEAVAPVPVPVAPVPPPAPASAYATSYREIHDAADDRAAAEHYLNTAQSYAEGSGSSSTSRTSTSSGSGKGYSYSYSSHSDGETYIVVSGNGKNYRVSGDWDSERKEEIERASKMAHGKFLWFTHQGKSYIVDDPNVLARIDAMYKPIEELGARQEALGKQQEELGRQQEALGKKQEQASVPTPDMSKEIAELNAAVTKLNAKKGGTVSQDELSDIQSKIGDIQGRLGELQGKMGEKQGEVGEEQGKLGERQGKLGEQQGELGEQQGKLSEEVDHKVKSIIDESLTNGSARPVQ